MKKILQRLVLSSLAVVLGFTMFSVPVSADEKRIIYSDDKKVKVIISEENNSTNKSILLEVSTEEEVFIGEVVSNEEKIDLVSSHENTYLYEHVVGHDGNYKYIIDYSFIVEVKDEDSEIHHVVREHTVTFEVNTVEDKESNSTETEMDTFLENEDNKIDQSRDVVPYFFPETSEVKYYSSEEISLFSGSNLITIGAGISGTYVTVTWNENPSFYWSTGGGSYPSIYVNGKTGYCIEALISGVSTGVASSKSIDEVNELRVMAGYPQINRMSDEQKKEISLIANYGYGYGNRNTDKWRWATQVAIWNELGFSVSGGINVTSEVSAIINDVANHMTRPYFHNSLLKVKRDEVITLQDPLLHLFDVSKTLTKGITVISKHDNTLTIKINSDNAELVLAKRQNIQSGTSLIYSDGVSQTVLEAKLRDPNRAFMDFEFALGNFELTKKNNFNELLAGVEYSFSYNSNMSAPFTSKKTNANGVLEIVDIDADAIVYYQETATISGHLIDSKIYQVKIAGGETVKQTRTNTAIEGQAELIKTDGDRKLLSGVSFGLYKQDGTFIQELVTDAGGKLLTPKLRFGSYYFQEHKAPWGYWTDKTKLEFTISNHEEVVSLTTANKLIQVHIEWNKTNEDGLPLEGVGFKIRNTDNGEFVTLKHANGKEIISEDIWYTDAQGDVFIKGLITSGNYELVEVASLEGYQEISPIAFKVDEDQDYINLGSLIGYSLNVGDVVNYWNRGDLVIAKLDIETLMPLPEFGFNLYGPDKELIGYYETGSDGMVTIQNLKYGMHTVEEIKVNGDYGLDTDNNVQEIFIEEHGVVYSVTFLNKHSDIKTSASFVELDKMEPKMVTLVDVVSYTDLRPEEKYLISGFLMNKETNEPILINGEKVEGSTAFTPVLKDGTVEVVFTFDSSKLETKTIVVFEDLYRDDILVVAHHDINDLDQTIELPEIKTSASFNSRDLLSSNIVTLIDVVSYSDLIPGREYTVNGHLMDKETESVLHIDGKEITGSTTFVPDEKDGKIEVMFTFDSNKLKTKTIVVFEDVYEEDRLVVSHHDIHDIEQTIEVLTIQINKIDRFSKERLKQAEFSMLDIDGNIIEVKWTDENGLVEFMIFEGETVDLKETAAPEGYLLSDEVVRVIGSKDIEGNLYTIEYFNDLMPIIQLPATGVDANPIGIIGVFVLMLGALLFLTNAKQNSLNKIHIASNGFHDTWFSIETTKQIEDFSGNLVSTDASTDEKNKKKQTIKRKISTYGSRKRIE